MTLGAGFTFFCLFPISVNRPKYRLLVSPTKQLLWNVPTHAEWAIESIQARGTRVEEQALPTSPALSMKTTANTAHAKDYSFYKAHCDGKSGHLIISTSSIRFVSNVGRTVHFILPYNQITSLEKGDRTVTKTIPQKLKTDSGRDLTLFDKVGKEWLLKSLD